MISMTTAPLQPDFRNLFVDIVVANETIRVLTDRLAELELPDCVNVQLVSVEDRSTINVLIWERGSGETLASGSLSCAAASAAVRLGLVESPVLVNVPGRSVSVEVDGEFNLALTGPVFSICDR